MAGQRKQTLEMRMKGKSRKAKTSPGAKELRAYLSLG